MEWSRGRLRAHPASAPGEIIDEMEPCAGTIEAIDAVWPWARSPQHD